jgi:hypothetical protein
MGWGAKNWLDRASPSNCQGIAVTPNQPRIYTGSGRLSRSPCSIAFEQISPNQSFTGHIIQGVAPDSGEHPATAGPGLEAALDIRW